MESLHISFQRVVDVDTFNGITLSSSLHLSHMFYVDYVIFMGKWNDSNINIIVHVLECFHRASGLRINMSKSKLLGIYVDADKVDQTAMKIGCVTLKTSFTYLGLKVGGLMSRIQSSKETVEAIHGGDGKIGNKAKSSFPSIWLDIVHEVELFKEKGTDLVNFIHKNLGNRANTLFWEEPWREGVPRGGVERVQFDAMVEKVEDGNSQILPLATGVSQGEIDIHAAIILDCRTVFDNSFHGFYDCHLMMNCNLKAVNKLEQEGIEKWSRAYFPTSHYNYMTSNSVESINSLTTVVRRVPITMLVEYCRDLLQRWYCEKRHKYEGLVASAGKGMKDLHVFIDSKGIGRLGGRKQNPINERS
ncbi:hypothetical protein Tco_1317711 [Tanacetum coccineum]